MSEARSSIFCRGPNWPRFCSSGPSPLPPPPPQLSHFRKIGPEKFSTNQSGCGLPTASASPGPGTATFQFFQPRYLALTFWRGKGGGDSVQPNYLQDFSRSNNNSALGMCLEADKNLGRNFYFQRSKCLLSKPWFSTFSPFIVSQFLTRHAVKIRHAARF